MAELSRYRSMLKTKMNPRVFWGASLIVGLLLALAVAAPASPTVCSRPLKAG